MINKDAKLSEKIFKVLKNIGLLYSFILSLASTVVFLVAHHAEIISLAEKVERCVPHRSNYSDTLFGKGPDQVCSYEWQIYNPQTVVIIWIASFLFWFVLFNLARVVRHVLKK